MIGIAEMKCLGNQGPEWDSGLQQLEPFAQRLGLVFVGLSAELLAKRLHIVVGPYIDHFEDSDNPFRRDSKPELRNTVARA